MASGPYPNLQRGTWQVQYFDGAAWKRVTVCRKRPGWKPGDPMPKKPPPEAMRALVHYQAEEDAARLKAGKDLDAGETIAAFLAAYAADYRLSRKPGSARMLDRSTRDFLGWCKAQKIATLSEVTRGVVDRWITNLAHAGSSAAYIQVRAGLLAGAWARAHKRGQLTENPWAKYEIPIRPARKARGSWSPEQFATLAESCRPWLRDVLAVGCNTGLRISALITLEWSDIRWAGVGEEGFGWLVVRPEHDKAGKGYRVPLSRACHDVLARRLVLHPDDCGHSRVLSGQNGRPIRSSNHTAISIEGACRRAGLPRPDSPNHHMRRTFGRWAVLGHLTGRPIPIYVVSKWLGHASVAMTEKYLALDLSNSQQWMAEA
jgi:integrase